MIHGLERVRKRYRYPVVTIGTFDGVHLGHREVISRTVERTKASGGTSIVLTFDPHPLKVTRTKPSPPSLISLQHRLRLIEALGVEVAIIVRFTKEFSRMTPESFVRSVLVEKLRTRELFLGYNYRFGREGSGGLDLMRTLADRYGFKVTKIDPVKVKGRIVSSTQVRSLIERGKLKETSVLLGRPFSILGTVVRGSERGRLLGYPTANIDPHHEVVPPGGVCAVKVRLDDELFGGILNIGTRPTFWVGQPSEPTIEVYIFDFDRKIYGRDIEIIFLKKVRDERKFSTKLELIRQIRLDEARARKLCGGRSSPRVACSLYKSR